MNCKQGDIAVIIRGNNMGRIVTCVEEVPAERVHARLWTGEIIRGRRGYAWWRIAEEVDVGRGSYSGKSNFVADFRLKPLRDKPGEDETLMWKPLELITGEKS